MKSEESKIERIVALAEVAELNPRVSADLRPDSLISFVPMAAVSEQSASVISEETRVASTCMKGFTPFKQNDVLVAKITPCFENGKIVIANIDHEYGFGSTEFHVIRPKEGVLNERYLLHCLRQPHVRLEGQRRMTGSAGQRRVPSQFLSTFALPLPTFKAQRRIAEILDRAEALRAKRRAALALLDELTQSIFLDMFGDPVTNPKGWELKTLGDSLTFQQYGPRFYNEKYSDEGIPIVRITDLDSQGNLDFNSMPRLVVSEEDREKYRLQTGDILFARTGATVGKVALIQSSDPECIAGAYFIVMRFSSELDPRFVRSVLSSRSIQQIVWIRSQQSAQQNFSGPGLRSLPMPHPPTKLQKVYADRIAAVESIKEPHRRSLTELDQLFASLQHRAFRGEL